MLALTTGFICLMREVSMSYRLMREQQLVAMAMCAGRTA
jgi:hypothetical protein